MWEVLSNACIARLPPLVEFGLLLGGSAMGALSLWAERD